MKAIVDKGDGLWFLVNKKQARSNIQEHACFCVVVYCSFFIYSITLAYEDRSSRDESRLSEVRGLLGRVQHGLTPMNDALSIWLGSEAPKVMVKWLSISWWRRFCVVRGFSLGWARRFPSLTLSLLREPNRPESLEELFLEERPPSDDWLVFAVEAVPLDSVWESMSELSDLFKARRTRSRIAIVIVGVVCGLMCWGGGL